MQRHDEKHLITQRLQMPLPELARLLQQVGALHRPMGNLPLQVLSAGIPCCVRALSHQMRKCICVLQAHTQLACLQQTVEPRQLSGCGIWSSLLLFSSLQNLQSQHAHADSGLNTEALWQPAEVLKCLSPGCGPGSKTDWICFHCTLV